MHATHFERSDALTVVGLPLRTTPERAPAEIPPLWQRFMQERFAQRLPRRADDAGIYAVYLDYESDYRGAYTLVVGVASESNAPVPAECRKVVIPAARYARFVAEGESAQVIWQTWAHINEQWPGRSQRRYQVDYERHTLDALLAGRGVSDVIVSVDE
jgi:predicted transcriptional regulator YdeE